jgi:hypothetical protein
MAAVICRNARKPFKILSGVSSKIHTGSSAVKDRNLSIQLLQYKLRLLLHVAFVALSSSYSSTHEMAMMSSCF